jgi:hypothetical protein
LIPFLASKFTEDQFNRINIHIYNDKSFNIKFHSDFSLSKNIVPKSINIYKANLNNIAEIEKVLNSIDHSKLSFNDITLKFRAE